MFKTTSVFLILSLFLLIKCDDDNNDIFIPTNQWQTVKKGQKIPKGLHVRINFETGVTEAKTIDETEAQPNALTFVPEESKLDSDLKPEDFKTIKDKFRSYDEIKKSLDDLNLTPKTDAEIIEDLVKRYKEVISEQHEEQLKILEDLEYLAHQYDNALEFVRQDGFKEIIYKNFNSTKSDVRRESLKLMTALLQNNVKPKIHAFETGGVGAVLRILSSDSDSGVKSAALSTLGANLRAFPVAQKYFVDNGGLAVLSKFFNAGDIKLEVRIVTMISDLLFEHKAAATDEKLSKFYLSSTLVNGVLELDWCHKTNDLLLALLITDKTDYDSIEKCLTAILSLSSHCGEKFDLDLIRNLKKQYSALSSKDSDQDFFKSLENICGEILLNVPEHVKTEL